MTSILLCQEVELYYMDMGKTSLLCTFDEFSHIKRQYVMNNHQ